MLFKCRLKNCQYCHKSYSGGGHESEEAIQKWWLKVKDRSAKLYSSREEFFEMLNIKAQERYYSDPPEDI